MLVVTADEPEWFEVARTTDSLQRVPLGSLQRLAVHAGRRSHPWRGAGIGLLAGVTVGGTLGALQVGSECPSYGCETSPAVTAAMGGVILGGLGALIGAGIGAFVKTDKWEEIPLETVRVSIVPQREGRFALGASIAF